MSAIQSMPELQKACPTNVYAITESTLRIRINFSNVQIQVSLNPSEHAQKMRYGAQFDFKRAENAVKEAKEMIRDGSWVNKQHAWYARHNIRSSFDSESNGDRLVSHALRYIRKAEAERDQGWRKDVLPKLRRIMGIVGDIKINQLHLARERYEEWHKSQANWSPQFLPSGAASNNEFETQVMTNDGSFTTKKFKRVSDQTARRYRLALNGVLDEMRKNGFVTWPVIDPAKSAFFDQIDYPTIPELTSLKVKSEVKQPTLSPEEAQRVMELESSKYPNEYKAFKFLCMTGLRPSELQAITQKSVIFSDGQPMLMVDRASKGETPEYITPQGQTTSLKLPLVGGLKTAHHHRSKAADGGLVMRKIHLSIEACMLLGELEEDYKSTLGEPRDEVAVEVQKRIYQVEKHAFLFRSSTSNSHRISTKSPFGTWSLKDKGTPTGKGAFYEFCNKLKLTQNFDVYNFRHTFATLALAASDNNYQMVASHMGHSVEMLSKTYATGIHTEFAELRDKLTSHAKKLSEGDITMKAVVDTVTDFLFGKIEYANTNTAAGKNLTILERMALAKN